MNNFALLLLGAIIMTSCGRNQSEQMLYDYQQENARGFNFDIKDLDFKIQKVEKLSDITAADSMKQLRFEFAEHWTNNPEQSLVDTLSFAYVKSVFNTTIKTLDDLQNVYERSVSLGINIYESQRKRNEAYNQMNAYKETLSKIEQIEIQYNEFSTNPDAIISTTYRASYSLKNPLLGNVRQTFDKIFYTNKEQNRFIREESADPM